MPPISQTLWNDACKHGKKTWVKMCEILPKCVKFACNYFKNSSASGGRSPTDPLGSAPGTRRGTPVPRPSVVLPILNLLPPPTVSKHLKAEMEPGLNLWPMTRPDPTRPDPGAFDLVTRPGHWVSVVWIGRLRCATSECTHTEHENFQHNCKLIKFWKVKIRC